MAVLILEIGDKRGVYSTKKLLWKSISHLGKFLRNHGSKRAKVWNYISLCNALRKGHCEILDKDEAIKGKIYNLRSMNAIQTVGIEANLEESKVNKKPLFGEDEDFNDDDIQDFSNEEIIDESSSSDEIKGKMKKWFE